MVALQIRNVPDDLRDALAHEADRRGQSLQGYLLGVLADEARRARNPTLLAMFAGRDDGATSDEAEQALRVAREQREAHLVNRAAPGTSGLVEGRR